jgi:hypothetical protein
MILLSSGLSGKQNSVGQVVNQPATDLLYLLRQ